MKSTDDKNVVCTSKGMAELLLSSTFILKFVEGFWSSSSSIYIIMFSLSSSCLLCELCKLHGLPRAALSCIDDVEAISGNYFDTVALE